MSYATKADFDGMKTRMNAVINFCLSLNNTFEAQMNDMKTRINAALNSCISLQNKAAEQLELIIQQQTATEQINSNISDIDAQLTASTSALETATLKNNVEQMRIQINALVNYLQSWIDNGNLSMADIRERLGPELVFETEQLPNESEEKETEENDKR